ncbi:thiosulfate/3-mercaptopyruvate sulfurtransferase [Cetobacterium ceti]|uniref:Thiosulfate/3-mercaptopyruvate sulfurtransferase n=1 Tax=Cetobacterium ceti TaxID=180163 RepID=A0A1T4KF82_9FUSO|nr:rhodanese-like domain-containing protein [Cetobacterium ceti]SJZ40995.1 thiosulfate/3-mercaptopyruvate sulfurtransferase [Cetobacterium ceti]
MKKIILIFLLLSTFMFGKTIDKNNYILVDTRESSYYNGWPEEGMERGGHIPGATDFSYRWLDKKNLTESNVKILNERLKEKGILNSEKEIILYNSNPKENEVVRNYLEKLGVKNIKTYDFNKYLENEKAPLVKFPGYEKLVPAYWVKKAIEGKVENSCCEKYKVYEVSWGPLNSAVNYLKGHIPGAVHINTDNIEPPPEWMINSDENLINFAKSIGIDKNSGVILYGENIMAAFRLGVIFEYLGVKDVKILNGGYNAWHREGYKEESGIEIGNPVDSFGSNIPLNKNYILNINEAKKVLKDNKEHELLVDIRSYKERIGEVSGYSYMHRKGRIKGSVWGMGGTSSVTLEDYRNIDNTMRNGNEILAMWKKLNIDPNKKLVFFCGSGWRASEALYYSQVLGFKNNSIYSNGWMEWSKNKNNPIELGVE